MSNNNKLQNPPPPPPGEVKFGKSYKNIIKFKKNFTEDNDTLLDKNNRISKHYKEETERLGCKLCGSNEKQLSFVSHGVEYSLCSRCGHLNGKYDDSLNFTNKAYIENDYSVSYKEIDKNAIFQRIHAIYTPKAEFLLTSLKEIGVNPKKCRFLDIGAGAGYFISALQEKGVDVKGVDISKEQVAIGKSFLNGDVLQLIPPDGMVSVIESATENVVSFIGVLEHIYNLGDTLTAISNNPHIQYVFFSVPMFSYSVIIESITPEVYNRLLGSCHTHLFTQESIRFLYDHYGWNERARWQFGTDMADLLRTITVKLEKTGNSSLTTLFQDKFTDILDDLQLVIDKSGFCSEIHALVEV